MTESFDLRIILNMAKSTQLRQWADEFGIYNSDVLARDLLINALCGIQIPVERRKAIWYAVLTSLTPNQLDELAEIAQVPYQYSLSPHQLVDALFAYAATPGAAEGGAVELVYSRLNEKTRPALMRMARARGIPYANTYDREELIYAILDQSAVASAYNTPSATYPPIAPAAIAPSATYPSYTAAQAPAFPSYTAAAAPAPSFFPSYTGAPAAPSTSFFPPIAGAAAAPSTTYPAYQQTQPTTFSAYAAQRFAPQVYPTRYGGVPATVVGPSQGVVDLMYSRLEGLSDSELKVVAREYDIRGRSLMHPDDLIDAIVEEVSRRGSRLSRVDYLVGYPRAVRRSPVPPSVVVPAFAQQQRPLYPPAASYLYSNNAPAPLFPAAAPQYPSAASYLFQGTAPVSQYPQASLPNLASYDARALNPPSVTAQLNAQFGNNGNNGNNQYSNALGDTAYGESTRGILHNRQVDPAVDNYQRAVAMSQRGLPIRYTTQGVNTNFNPDLTATNAPITTLSPETPNRSIPTRQRPASSPGGKRTDTY